ncbi:predicted protein [Uncinocarpus reesii 1704]|uniref:Uncharacterized protein n=1 Tax=Uncinocarpus reesii (strain UAMH 1704) TaxID=336963 RepID=C4JSK3_UNCRE|nr:uncharacterized protein UREG_05442 [Uncinocarpus reesii 1704]EEP80600.1 predicted protein [Uncinocarpus reesii 1704]
MNTRALLRLSRPSILPVPSPLLATACLSSRIPQYFNIPRLNASLTTDASSTSSPSSSSAPSSSNPPPSTANQQPPIPPTVTAPSFSPKPTSHKLGTVISAGKMDKVVTVLYTDRVWDKHVRKYWPKKTTFRVCDPRNSLREGDVIEFSSGYRSSKTVRHVVEKIISPFGVRIDERPPIMSPQERAEEKILNSKTGNKVQRLGKIKMRVLQRLADEGMVPEDTAEKIRAEVKMSLETWKRSRKNQVKRTDEELKRLEELKWEPVRA